MNLDPLWRKRASKRCEHKKLRGQCAPCRQASIDRSNFVKDQHKLIGDQLSSRRVGRY